MNKLIKLCCVVSILFTTQLFAATPQSAEDGEVNTAKTTTTSNKKLKIDTTGDNFLGVKASDILSPENQNFPGYYYLFHDLPIQFGEGATQRYNHDNADKVITAIRQVTAETIPNETGQQKTNPIWLMFLSVTILGIVTTGLMTYTQVTSGVKQMKDASIEFFTKVIIIIFLTHFVIGGIGRFILGTTDKISGISFEGVSGSKEALALNNMTFTEDAVALVDAHLRIVQALNSVEDTAYEKVWTKKEAKAEAIKWVNNWKYAMEYDYGQIELAFIQLAKTGSVSAKIIKYFNLRYGTANLVSQNFQELNKRKNNKQYSGLGGTNNSTYTNSTSDLARFYLAEQLKNRVKVIMQDSNYQYSKPTLYVAPNITPIEKPTLNNPLYFGDDSQVPKLDAITIIDPNFDKERAKKNAAGLTHLLSVVDKEPNTTVADAHKLQHAIKAAILSGAVISAVSIWVIPLAIMMMTLLISIPKELQPNNMYGAFFKIVAVAILTAVIVDVFVKIGLAQATNAVNSVQESKVQDIGLDLNVAKQAYQGAGIKMAAANLMGNSSFASILQMFIIGAPVTAGALVVGGNGLAKVAKNTMNGAAQHAGADSFFSKLGSFSGGLDKIRKSGANAVTQSIGSSFNKASGAAKDRLGDMGNALSKFFNSTK